MTKLITKQMIMEAVRHDMKIMIFENFCSRLTDDKALIESITQGISLIEAGKPMTGYSKGLAGSSEAREKFEDSVYVREQFNRLLEFVDGTPAEYATKIDAVKANMSTYEKQLEDIVAKEAEINDKVKLNDALTNADTKKANAARLDAAKAKLADIKADVELELSEYNTEIKEIEESMNDEEESIRNEIIQASYSALLHVAEKASKVGTGGASPEITAAIAGDLVGVLNERKFIENIANNLPDTKGAFGAFLYTKLKQSAVRLSSKNRNELINVGAPPTGTFVNWRPNTEVVNLRTPEWRKAIKEHKDGPEFDGEGEGLYRAMEKPLPNEVRYRNAIYVLAPGVKGIDQDDNTESPDKSDLWTEIGDERTAASTDVPVSGSDGSSSSLGDTLSSNTLDPSEEAEISEIQEYLTNNINDTSYINKIRRLATGTIPKISPEEGVNYLNSFTIDELYELLATPGYRVSTEQLKEVFGDRILDENGEVTKVFKNFPSAFNTAFRKQFHADQSETRSEKEKRQVLDDMSDESDAAV